MYNVLFFDDELRERQLASKIAAKINNVNLLDVKNIPELQNAVSNYFIHLAIIDLQIGASDGDLKGIEALRIIRNTQPQCESVVYSSHLDREEALSDIFNPFDRIADGLLVKEDAENTLAQLLDSRASNYADDKCVISDPAFLIENIRSQLKLTNTNEDYLAQELQFLIAQALVGPAIVGALDAQPLLTVFPFDEQGRSRSFVCGGIVGVFSEHTQKTPEKNDRGLLVVLKFTRAEEAREEIDRYKAFIRSFVSQTRRVDVIGESLGSQIGLICYTFAGAASPQSVKDLSKIVNSDTDRSIKIMNGLFENSELHAIQAGKCSLTNYATKRFGKRLNLRSFSKTVLLKLLEKVAKADSSLRLVGNVLSDEHGLSVTIPDKLFKGALFRDDLQMVVSHGDLHCKNIFISPGDEAILIDYRHSGPSPQFIDFAVLEASIRLSCDVCDNLFDNLKKQKEEKTLCLTPWGNSSATRENHLRPWERMSQQLRKLAKKNHPNASAAEYAATCIVWAASLTTLRSLEEKEKCRMLAWILALKGMLDSGAD